MRQHSRFFFVFIILLTVLAILINLPKEIHLSFTLPKLPGMAEPISVNQKFPVLNADSLLRPIGISRDFSLRKGLDLEGGTSITLKADTKDIPAEKRDDALDSAREVIERRINFFGVSEPIVQTSRVNQDYRVIVEIPGVTDVNQAVNLVGQTAKLTFWEEGAASPSAELASPSANLPFGITTFLGPDPKITNLSGSDLEQASVIFDPNTGKPEVQLSFTSDGSQKFAEITERNVGKIVAMVLDDQVIQAPRVDEVITGGNAVIRGDYTTEQAKQLVIQLNAGALPVSLSVLQQQAIGATLGEESLQKSLIAGSIGFIVIVIFMIVLYGRLGVIASLALVVYMLLTLALFRIIPVTLTLAGIAGFILSVGIAVDANILIFERMREELRRGRTKEVALKLGFSRAWSSIRDSNIASLITCGVLYYFGTGIVRGFALTLAVGVLVSMFSAITVTKTFLSLWYKEK